MRCFVAIELNEECRFALGGAVGRLRSIAGDHKWLPTGSMHLTLKFIGAAGEERLPEISRALHRACLGVAPFTMRVEGLGGFPPAGRPKVIFAGVKEPSGQLMRLAERVDNELAEGVGIGKETRGFVPHITLGRVRRNRSCPPVQFMSGELETTSFGAVDVNEVVLMRSELFPDVARYSVVERFGFQSPEG